MTAPSPAPNDALARYRLVEEVGQGGMAVVWRAVDTTLEREVAVKVLHPHLAARPESRQRFSREARAVARLRHPNLLEIFDFSGESAAQAYIVTEFIRGQTLRRLVDTRPMPLPELGAMAVRVLSMALEHAHAQGIVHRDLKPENVMVREDGVLKLTDFGIAKILDRDENMTATGALLGSPAHMAPEVIDGKDADQRSDIFSLGTILYWLAAGRMPFAASNPGALLKLISDGRFEDPQVCNPAISDALARVIRRALARDPAGRPNDAAALRKEIDVALTDAGLEDFEAPLAAWLRAPDDGAGLKERMVAFLVERGGQRLKSRKFAPALADLNRVLALSPGHEKAKVLLGKARRRSKRRRALLVALAVSAGLGAVQVAIEMWPAPAPVAAPPPDGTLVALAPPPPEKPPAPPPVENRRISESPESKIVPKRPPAPPPAPGSLEVVVDTWARVVVDGVERARDKIANLQLPAGKHLVRLEREDCCRPIEEEVVIEPGKPTEFRRRLDPLDGQLVVKGPPDALVSIDGGRAVTITATGGTFPVVMDKDQIGDARLRRTVRIRIDIAGREPIVETRTLGAGKTETITVEPAP